MKITISKSQWEEMGKKAGWTKIALTHGEISKEKNPPVPCAAHHLIQVDEGLQCSNCMAVTRDHGKTWEKPEQIKPSITSPSIEKIKSLNATEQQIDSAKKIITRYKKEPKNIYPDFGGKAIMLDFGFIMIGIEPDGHAHS